MTLALASLAALLLAAPVAWAAGVESAPGITEPLHDARISSSVPGRIKNLPIKEGAAVKKGDVIVELDRDMEELEVARRKLVWESKAEASAAAARVDTLKRDLDATHALYDKTQSVSREELEKKDLEYKMALCERDRLKDAEERERIEYDMAVAQLQRRSITAPFDGVVTDILPDLGEDCEPRQPLARTVDASQCYLVCNVDAALAERLREGQAVEVEVDACGKPLRRKGTLSFLAPVVDPASGLRRVKALFDNADRSVTPGVAGRLLFPAVPAPQKAADR